MHVSHGHSVHRQQMERVGGQPPLASAKPAMPSGHGGGLAITDQVDLSPMAQKFVETHGQCKGSGKSMHAVAHRARAMIEANPQLADMPFGQVVSKMIHGTLELGAPAAGVGDTGETAAVTGTGDAAEVPVLDGEATPIVEGEDADLGVHLPAEDDSEPTEGEDANVEVLPQIDDGLEIADGEDAVDGQITADIDDAGGPKPPEPAVTVDTTSALFDMVDDSGEEPETYQAA